MPSSYPKSICCGLLLLPVLIFAQARIVLNGAKINITNGAQLVVDNPAADAIKRYDGHIISEGETNTIKWNLGNTAGTYTVPLGYGNSDFLPVSFTKNAGAGSGSFLFAMYRTPWKNSDLLPAGVTHVTLNGSNNSALLVDRFWKIKTSNYTTRPSLTNVTFTYADAETALPNNITESSLEARHWNGTAQTWTDYTPAAIVNTVANTVLVASVPAAQLQDWWMLVDNVRVLPLQWLQFTATAAGTAARLDWQTANEKAGAVFTLERSADGIHFTVVANRPGTGNNSAAQSYSFLDKEALSGNSYYRIIQTESNGTQSYSPVRRVFIKATAPLFTVYPNPVTARRCIVNLHSNAFKNVRLQLINISGSLVWSQAVADGQQVIPLQLPGAVAAGAYMLKITTAQGIMQHKLVVQ